MMYFMLIILALFILYLIFDNKINKYLSLPLAIVIPYLHLFEEKSSLGFYQIKSIEKFSIIVVFLAMALSLNLFRQKNSLLRIILSFLSVIAIGIPSIYFFIRIFQFEQSKNNMSRVMMTGLITIVAFAMNSVTLQAIPIVLQISILVLLIVFISDSMKCAENKENDIVQNEVTFILDAIAIGTFVTQDAFNEKLVVSSFFVFLSFFVLRSKRLSSIINSTLLSLIILVSTNFLEMSSVYVLLLVSYFSTLFIVSFYDKIYAGTSLTSYLNQFLIFISFSSTSLTILNYAGSTIFYMIATFLVFHMIVLLDVLQTKGVVNVE